MSEIENEFENEVELENQEMEAEEAPESEEVLEAAPEVSVEGTELEEFDSVEIEEVNFIEDERIESIIESILFSSDRPVGMASIQQVFKGTNVKKDKIRRALDKIAVEYAGARRGVTLEEVPGGYQLRTKIDNMDFLRHTVKSKPFKLSGPALEVLAIVAYKQPMIKSEIDAIRGVESGHLLRALMERGLVNFEGKSEMPGRPMQYGTTRKFLEIFGLRNTKELPTLSQIDELLPEGIGEEEEKKETLSMVTDNMSETVGMSYSQGEEELNKIQDQLENINTSTDFFEVEKIRQKEKRDAEKAQDLREAIAMNEEVATRDLNWLRKFDEAVANGTTLAAMESAKAKESKMAALAKLKEKSQEFAEETAMEAAASEEAGIFSEDSEAEHIEDQDNLHFTEEADEIDEEKETSI